MATDTLQLSSNIGTGDKLSVNTLAGGEKVQNIKLLSAADASETEIHADHGLAANALRVELPTDGTGKVGLNAGTAAIGTVILGTSTASAGKMELEASSAQIGGVTAAGAVSHDAAGTSIKPLLSGNIATNQDGSIASSVSENDLTYNRSDREGLQFVNQTHPYRFDVSATYASAQTNTTLQAAVASVSIHVTDIIFSNGAVPGTFLLTDGSGGTIKITTHQAVNSVVTHSFRNPLRLTANTLLAFTSTSATSHSVTVSGYYAI